MSTNHFKIAYDKVKEIIREDYPRFRTKDRLFLRDRLLPKDVSFEDGIMLTPLTDELLEERTNQGRDDAFHLTLVYFINQQPDIDYDVLTQFAEDLIKTFEANRALTTFWHSLSIENIVYSIELPAIEDGEILDVYGFTMEITILKGKYV